MIPLKDIMSTIPLRRQVITDVRTTVALVRSTLPWYRRLFWW